MGSFLASGRAGGARAGSRRSRARGTASVLLLAVLFILSPFQPPVGVVGFTGVASLGGVNWDHF